MLAMLAMSPFLSRAFATLYILAALVAVIFGSIFEERLSVVPVVAFPLMRQVCVGLLAAGAVAVLLTRFDKRLVWETVFFFASIAGSVFGSFVFFPWKIALFFSLILPCAVVLLRNVLIQNMAFFWGALGFSLFLASWLPSEVLLAVLVAFTAYDMLAAHPDGPIVSLARGMARVGQVPGFILPPGLAGFFQSTERLTFRASDASPLPPEGAGPEGLVQAALLGPGDLVFILAIVIRASLVDVRMGIACVLGLFASCLFLLRGGLHPRTLLPAMAAGVGLPFLVFLVIGYFVS